MPISALHLLAMAVWLGGVAFLAAVALPAGDPGPAVRRFSRLAFICISVLAASGLYEAWRSVGSWGALTGTAYGRLVIGKTAGFAVVIGLGAISRRAVSRRALPSLRDTVVTETAVGISILALTAVLVEVQPGRTAYTPPVHASAAFDTGGPHGSGLASLVVDPPRVGFATFDLAVVDTLRAPVREAQISAALQLDAQRLGPLPVTFTDVGTGHYRATAPVTVAGAWVLRVTVRSDALNETTIAFPVNVR